MKRVKQTPPHNRSGSTRGEATHESYTANWESEVAQTVEDGMCGAGALPVSADPATLHRDSDFDTLRPAETLAAFVTFCADVRQRYQGNLQVQEDTNLARQDLLHCIELSDNMRVADGFKMYRKLREVSRVRRDAKNENDLLQPLYEFLAQTDFESRLRRVLGDTRTRAEVVGKRQYSLRTDIVEREDV